jgi:signal transduction histidine kinase
MKKLYVRFALVMLLTVAVSAFLGTLFTVLFYMSSDQSEQNFLFAARTGDLLIPLLTVLIGAFIITMISKKAVAPIVTLSQAVRRITAGDLDTDIQVSKRKDEIGALVRDFELMVKELRRNELLRKDFINNISHEFKTPLSIIEGYAQMLAEPSLDDGERIHFAQSIKSESERLRKLSSSILRLSSLESQVMQTDRTPFRLDEQIRQAVLALEPKWSARAITFDIELCEQTYSGDEDLLSQIWLNLLENAVKFSSDGGLITIRMSSAASYVEVVIEDSGIGMDAQTKARAFEQFFQGEVSHNTEGNGLGLAIVKSVVALHSGEITMESETDEGTTVRVRLPL